MKHMLAGATMILVAAIAIATLAAFLERAAISRRQASFVPPQPIGKISTGEKRARLVHGASEELSIIPVGF
jgi:hypothetical protein